MIRSAAPMFHVPDVAATADWYQARGFPVRDLGPDGDAIVFAAVSLGASELLLGAGGQPSDAFRRDADLYVTTDDVDALFARLAGQVEVVEGLHETFYGAREFIIRDCNRFWITFGQRLAK